MTIVEASVTIFGATLTTVAGAVTIVRSVTIVEWAVVINGGLFY